MIEPTPITEPLDVFLREMVQALRAAVNRGMQSADPPETDRMIQDCKEILDVIMAGRVQQRIAE